MRTTLTRLHRDERGMSLVFVGVGFMAFLAATTLAIDVGMFATARSQAQNSADAGALSGAVALYFDDYNNRTASGPAVQSALAASRSNDVINQQVSVQPGDVTFPTSPSGLNNRVRVHVYRTSARGNPLQTLMGRFFGVDTANIDAVATAEASPANAMTCVKPFTIPDRWIEKQDPGGFDSLNSTFDSADQHGNPLGESRHLHPGRSARLHRLQRRARQGHAADDPRGHGQQHQPEHVLLLRHWRRHRRRRVPLEHRQLQHDLHGLGRPAPDGARQHGGSDRPGRRRSDRARIPTPIGTPTLNSACQHEAPQPTCCRDSALRPGLLRHREVERSRRRLEGRQLPGLLHRAPPGQQRLRPHHADLADSSRAPASALRRTGAFPKAIRLVE